LLDRLPELRQDWKFSISTRFVNTVDGYLRLRDSDRDHGALVSFRLVEI
jgi:hypothetical protein